MINFSRDVVKLANGSHYRAIFQQCLEAISENRLEHFVDILGSLDDEEAGTLQFTQGYDGNTLIHTLSSGVISNAVDYINAYDERLNFELNIHHPNRVGMFPCHIAVDYNETGMLEHLHRKGANLKQNVLFTKTEYGKYNAYTLAAKNFNTDMLEFMVSLNENIDTIDGSGKGLDDYLLAGMTYAQVKEWRADALISMSKEEFKEDSPYRDRVVAKLM